VDCCSGPRPPGSVHADAPRWVRQGSTVSAGLGFTDQKWKDGLKNADSYVVLLALFMLTRREGYIPVYGYLPGLILKNQKMNYGLANVDACNTYATDQNAKAFTFRKKTKFRNSRCSVFDMETLPPTLTMKDKKKNTSACTDAAKKFPYC
jgi:hypothetical protein